VVLVSDTGPAPMNIGAVLVLDDAEGLDLPTLAAVLGPRVTRVPRLRQRLVQAPPLCGRPVWQDDPAFTLAAHLEHADVSDADPSHAGTEESGGRDALLGLAADAFCRHLPRDRPLWSLLLVTGLSGRQAALVIVLHHVVADGIGGLAVLAALADAPATGSLTDTRAAGGAADTPAREAFPRPPATRRELAADALRGRLTTARGLWPALRRALGGLRELGVGAGRPVFAGRTSLNRPTGARRRLTAVTLERGRLVDAAHRRECTVNDLLLAAASGAMASTLRRRGDDLRTLIVSVPVAAAPGAGGPDETRTGAGNRTGVRPIAIPTDPDPRARLRAVAAWSRQWQAAERAQSAAPLSLAFRGLGRLGLLGPLLAHQRLVHTFLSNVRGPVEPLTLAGLRVAEVLPVSVSPGNVGVAFDALSYAEQLVVTVVADPDLLPEQERLTEDLRAELLGQLA
jgi:WS/DGAT/MGAT family acyltransferase